MKKIDLSKVKLQMIDGSIQEMDVSKELSQVIFQNTQSISEHSFAMELYNNPIVTTNEENAQIIKLYSKNYFKAFVQVAILKMLGEEI